MTEKERTEQRQLINDILGAFVERIEGQFGIISVELKAIKEQTTKTNGTVIRHEKELRDLHDSEILHVVNCPHNKSIEEIMTVKKNWKVYGIAALFVGFIAVASTVTIYETIRESFKKDNKIEQRVQSIESENKVQNKKIDNNKKAINDQGVENSFQNSIKEK